ncbi:MAG: PEP-CTERM sorting domain-containing protein [Planctomycetota bacterium]
MKRQAIIPVVVAIAFIGIFVTANTAQASLLTNPSFADVDTNGSFGDGWSSFGNAGFNAFFGGGNGHVSLFADNPGNSGGVFQLGIPATPNTTYRFSLTDNFFEANFDGTVQVGLEYYLADDSTKVGEDITSITSFTSSFSVFGTSVADAEIVRPIILFQGGTNQGSSDNAFFFEAELVVIPEPATLSLLGVAGVALLRRYRSVRGLV